MKKKLLTLLLCTVCSAGAFAGNVVHNRQHVDYPDYYSEERVEQYQGKYNVSIIVEQDGKPVKMYDIDAISMRDFLVVNGQQTTYNDPYAYHEMKKEIDSVLSIRGVIMPSRQSLYLHDVYFTIGYSDALGSQKSCHGKTCVDVPQEIITNHDVKLQAYEHTVTPVTQFTNSQGENIKVNLVVNYFN